MRHFNGHILVDVNVTLKFAILAEDDMKVGTNSIDTSLVNVNIMGSQRNYIEKGLSLDKNFVYL